MLSVHILKKFNIFIFMLLTFSLYTLKKFKIFYTLAFKKLKKTHPCVGKPSFLITFLWLVQRYSIRKNPSEASTASGKSCEAISAESYQENKKKADRLEISSEQWMKNRNFDKLDWQFLEENDIQESFHKDMLEICLLFYFFDYFLIF